MKVKIKKQKRKSIALSLSPEEIMIIVPDLTSKNNVIKVLNAYFQSQDIQLHEYLTEKEFRNIVNEWVNKLEVKPNRIQVRKMRNKWASCSSKRNVTFNSLLIRMPKEFAEYVICHDLLHLKVPKHNKLFRSLLSTYMPDWRERIVGTIESMLNQKMGRENKAKIESLLELSNSGVYVGK